jgi:hypothetical protein
MIDKNSNLTDQNLDGPSSRRQFLTRASVGAALATIPAKSVWATGLTNSIVASGHGSDFAGGTPLMLKLPDQWLRSGVSALGRVYANLTYTASPVINWKLRRCFNGKESKLRLCHLLGDKIELTHFIEQKVKGKVGSQEHDGRHYDIELTERGLSKNKVRRYTWAKLIRHLGGEDGSPSELNSYIISTYLNARYSGRRGIHYPIVNAVNGNHAPYQNAELFISKLHIAAVADPVGTLRTLKALHHHPESLQHIAG